MASAWHLHASGKKPDDKNLDKNGNILDYKGVGERNNISYNNYLLFIVYAFNIQF